MTMRMLFSIFVLVVCGLVGCVQPSSKYVNADGTLRLTEHEVAVTGSNFESLLASETPVLIDFSAGWCPPCLQMKPLVEAFAASAGDDAIVAIVDMTSPPPDVSAIADELNVQSLPTFLVLRNGREIGRQIGPPGEPLEDWFNQVVAAAE